MCKLSRTFLRISLLLFLFMGIESCKEKETKDTLVKISTDFGDITLKLYDETPLHRDNFIKLVKDDFYKDVLFHRVIDGFMIQGGDPESKNALPEIQLGNGGPGYTIPAEFHTPEIYHKKGALAAARQADNVNPKQASSGSQFYIVQGNKVSVEQLKNIVLQKNDKLRQDIFYNDVLPKYKDTVDVVQRSGDAEKIKAIQEFIMAEVDRMLLEQSAFNFSDEQVEQYTTVGGTPFLDGDYTVFGEVVEGLSIIDSIAKVEVDENARPLENIKMRVKIVN